MAIFVFLCNKKRQTYILFIRTKPAQPNTHTSFNTYLAATTGFHAKYAGLRPPAPTVDSSTSLTLEPHLDNTARWNGGLIKEKWFISVAVLITLQH